MQCQRRAAWEALCLQCPGLQHMQRHAAGMLTLEEEVVVYAV